MLLYLEVTHSLTYSLLTFTLCDFFYFVIFIKITAGFPLSHFPTLDIKVLENND